MAATNLVDVTNQIQEYWAPVFTKELRESLLLGGLVNREYQGEIKNGGDTVYVSQVAAATGELLTIDNTTIANHDADSFSPEAMSTSRISIVANRRAVASFQVEDLVDIQSQLDKEHSELRESLLFGMKKQINDHLYSLVSPSTSAPDHELSSVTDLNLAQMSAIRVLAGAADWPTNKPWYGLCSPQYYADVMDDSTLSSRDYVGDDLPTVAGRMAFPRFNFNLFEDSSRTGDYGLFFYPDFMHMVMQQDVRVKVSDLHSNKQFGYNISVDVVFGASLGVDGANKHIRVQ